MNISVWDVVVPNVPNRQKEALTQIYDGNEVVRDKFYLNFVDRLFFLVPSQRNKDRHTNPETIMLQTTIRLKNHDQNLHKNNNIINNFALKSLNQLD